ncbi:MAG: hypothetical protein CMM48_06120 [Rhodospirillaceae bacterium]|nr:hypothetical protein [Rhodospirillaceae bacterium]HAA93170.1 DUF962 domain-containing protein [Rhodospirillaceae bacterium]|tara:strand:- start:693 stop:1028 length:336 start_codon:yes stop_codon:yes gene_type:complete
MSQRYNSFEEFWPAYLRAHSRPATRACHYFATIIGVGCAVAALVTQIWWLVLVGIAGGYGVAVASHPVIEGNSALVRPHTVWAACSDLKMFGLWATGRLKNELEKHQIGRG